jgi:hypothetical protein
VAERRLVHWALRRATPVPQLNVADAPVLREDHPQLSFAPVVKKVSPSVGLLLVVADVFIHTVPMPAGLRDVWLVICLITGFC